MGNINFLKETEELLEDKGKKWEDVRKITHTGNELTIEEFKEIANIEYDNGYGFAHFQDYMIIGDDWWLERGEYDGSEWWSFRVSPFGDL